MKAWLLVLLPALAYAQSPDEQLKQAGVCARCHVISVVEWGVSKHWKVGTNCVACHGASQGHVIDERNNVKPERLPSGAAIEGLCATCHKGGCPSSRQTAACQNCHHVHALVNPKTSAAAADVPVAAPVPRVPDPAANLARELRVPGLDLPMVLVRGGDVELGAAGVANTRPIHTVSLKPFYLGVNEVTEAQWQSVMGSRQVAFAGSGLPATGISWQDAQAFLRKLNDTVPGAGFRLPSEAEWEFAARAGGFEGDAIGASAPQTAGRGHANSMGFFDMRGNVWEWCSSLDRPYPYIASDGRESPEAPGLRVLRGGGYADPAGWITPATRHADRPVRRLPWYGFRIARDIPVSH